MVGASVYFIHNVVTGQKVVNPKDSSYLDLNENYLIPLFEDTFGYNCSKIDNPKE